MTWQPKGSRYQDGLEIIRDGMQYIEQIYNLVFNNL